MTEEPKPPATKKKVPPAALIGSAVAIGAALIVIFVSGGKDKEPPKAIELGPDMGQVQTAPTPATEAAQLAQVQVAPAPGAVATTPVNFENETLTFSAVFPDAPAGDPAIAALRKDAESYLARKKQQPAPKLTA